MERGKMFAACSLRCTPLIASAWWLADSFNAASSRYWRLRINVPLSTVARRQSTESSLSTVSHGGRATTEAPAKPRRQRRLFTLEEDLKIIQLRSEGYEYDWISKQLSSGRSVQSLRDRYSRHLRPQANDHAHLLPSPLTTSYCTSRADYSTDEKKRIMQWRADPRGKKLSGLAKELGRSVRSLAQHMERLVAESLDNEWSAPSTDLRLNAIGRKSRDVATPLEAMTVVYLRKQRGMIWRKIMSEIPRWSLHSLRINYYVTWLPKYESIALSDPRQWSEEKLKTFATSAGRQKHRQKASSSSFDRHVPIGLSSDQVSRMSTSACQREEQDNAPERQCEVVDSRRVDGTYATMTMPKLFSAEEDTTISRMRDEGWSKSEDEVLRNMKADRRSWREIGRALPNRGLIGMKSRYAESLQKVGSEIIKTRKQS